MISLDQASIADLSARFSGVLLRPDASGYDDVRRVHNGMIDRHPALIARCLGSADIADAVNFARTYGLDLAVRGGGHNVAGRAVCDDGLMLDLSLMKGIHVDPVRRTARAQGGVTWREFNRETQAHGLATTGGVISTTGISGVHPRWRPRVAHGQARAGDGQPALSGGRDRFGRHRAGEQGGER